jgi:hypothetical protein
MALLLVLAHFLELIADVAFLGAPFSRRTTRVLGAVLVLLLAILGWLLWWLWAS